MHRGPTANTSSFTAKKIFFAGGTKRGVITSRRFPITNGECKIQEFSNNKCEKIIGLMVLLWLGSRESSVAELVLLQENVHENVVY